MGNRKSLFRKGRKPTQEQLNSILDVHWKWVFSEEGGQRADLEGANLSHCNLQEIFLSGACFRSAKLRGADFRRAVLCGTDLRDAKLQFADLRDADLSYADLRGADISDAKLDGAILHHADLNGLTNSSENIVQIISLGYADLPSDIRYFVDRNIVQCEYGVERSLEDFMSHIDERYPADSVDKRLMRRKYFALIDYFKEMKSIAKSREIEFSKTMEENESGVFLVAENPTISAEEEHRREEPTTSQVDDSIPEGYQ